MKRVLAFDLAGESGDAWRREGRYRASAIDLDKRQRIDEHLLALREWAESLILEAGPDMITVEIDIRPSKGSRILQAYYAVVRFLAGLHSLRFVYNFNVQAARNWAFGQSIEGKDDAQAAARAPFMITGDQSEDESTQSSCWRASSASAPVTPRSRPRNPIGTPISPPGRR